MVERWLCTQNRRLRSLAIALGEVIMEERGTGWLLFAGIALTVTGIMRLFDAIWVAGANPPSRTALRAME